MNQQILFDPPAVIEAEGPAIVFEIFGEPRPQGSKIPQVIYRKGPKGPEPVVKNGRVIVVARDDNPDLRAWRQGVAQAARRAYGGPLLIGAVSLEITFYRPRPRSHYGAGRNAGRLKPYAPKWPTTKPDNTKLRRAIEDALSGVIYRDDSQIVDGMDYKRYGDCYRTVVRVESLDGLTEKPF